MELTRVGELGWHTASDKLLCPHKSVMVQVLYDVNSYLLPPLADSRPPEGSMKVHPK